MNWLSTFLLLLPIAGFVWFWRNADRRGWRSVRLLAASVTLALLALALILRWGMGPDDGWVLWVGAGAAVWSGLALLSLPLTAPEGMDQLKLPW